MFGIELPVTVTFDQPSASALASYLAGRGAAKESGAKQDAFIAQSGVPEGLHASASAASVPSPVAEVGAIVASIVGSEVGFDEPLMAAGLDSLGEKFVQMTQFLPPSPGDPSQPCISCSYAPGKPLLSSSFKACRRHPASQCHWPAFWHRPATNCGSGFSHRVISSKLCCSKDTWQWLWGGGDGCAQLRRKDRRCFR